MIQESEGVLALGRHLVGILVYDEGRPSVDLLTTFVVSMADTWILVTAGHVLEDLRKDRVGPIRSRLIDSLGLAPDLQHSPHEEPVPFDLDSAEQFSFGNEESFDCGMIVLDDYYRRLLERNHIVPLGEESWASAPDAPDAHIIVGFPSALTAPPSKLHEWASVNPVCTMHALQRIADRPAAFTQKATPRAYFRIAMDDSLRSIRGMSGSPIFAFRMEPDGQGYRYWLVGIQSDWIPRLQCIEVCPVDSFLRYTAQGISVKISES